MSNFGHIHERVTSVIQQRPLTLLGSKNAFEYNASTAFLASEGVNNEDPAESSSLINTYGEITRKVLRAPPSGVTTFSVLLGSPSGAMVGALDVNAQIAVNMVIPGKMGNSLSDRVASLRVPLLRLNASANAIGNTWDESNFPHWHWFDYLRDIGAAEEFAFANDYEIVYDSPMSRMARAEELVGVQRTMELLAPFAQINPEVLDVFDPDALARLTAEVSGVPTPVLRSQDAVDKLRQQRAQQTQEAAMVQAAQPLAGAMKDAAQANQLLQGA